jgi:hypothetical protein
MQDIYRTEKAATGALEFCPKCGTTVRWQIEIVPNRQVFALGI